eukprot:gene2222-2261_t
MVLDFLNRINWYIWAGLLLIITLFILGGIRSYLIQSMATGRNALVPLEIIQELSEQLSPEALDVLRWVWKDKEVPINYGNMRMALRQLRSGRARKLALAREQKAVIDAALAANAAASTLAFAFLVNLCSTYGMKVIFTASRRNFSPKTTRVNLSVERACSPAMSGEQSTFALPLLLAIGCRA